MSEGHVGFDSDEALDGVLPATPAASGGRRQHTSSIARVRPIRAVERALQVVGLLIASERLTIAQVVKASGLPRTTAYRVLRTLVAQGFATEWPEFGTFGPGPVLAQLATHSDPLTAVVEAARPHARALSDKVRWPVSIATVVGNEIVVRYATDREAALSFSPQNVGVRLPLLESAAGRLHIAFADESRRALWLDLAYDRRNGEAAPTETREALESELATIRRQGFASYVREGRLTMRRSLAAPIRSPGGAIDACLVLRFAGRAIRTRQEMQQLVVELCAAAEAATRAVSGAR